MHVALDFCRTRTWTKKGVRSRCRMLGSGTKDRGTTPRAMKTLERVRRCSTLALVAFAVQLGSQASESFGFSPLTPAIKTCSTTRSREGASKSHLLVGSATTAAGLEEKTERRRSLLRRGEASSSRSKRRLTGRAIRRRARRLHRIRRKQQARTTQVNDVGLESQHNFNASFPATRERPPAAGDGQKAARLAVAAATATAESLAAEEALSVLINEESNKPSSSADSASTSRRRRHPASTVKGRRIAKAGEGRGLWRSIFGPRPLLQVHSVEDLSRLVDVEGWALEDLSVLTPAGTRPVDRIGVKSIGVKSSEDEAGLDADMVSVGHPAVRAVLERAARGTTPSAHGDGRRIGLAIEVRPCHREPTARERCDDSAYNK